MARTKETAGQSHLSQERVQDSSDEDNSPPEKVTSTRKQKPQPSGSAVQKTSKKSKPKSPSPSPSPSAASEQESTDESSESETGQDDSDDDSTTTSASSQKRTAPAAEESLPKKKSKTTTSSAVHVHIAPKPFKAPPGYGPVIVSASDYTSEMGTLFDDLSAKQIWHISVPDSVSIESIKELDIEAAMKGEPIVSRDGIDYSMHAVESQNQVVLLPNGAKMSYRQSAKRVEHSYLLQETTTIPKSKTEASLVFAATKSGESKPIRKQPEGLKMRYVPYGAPAIQEAAEDADVEMRDSLDIPPELEPKPTTMSPQTTSKKTKKKPKQGQADEKSPKKKLREADGPVSHEKKKKKKRRLVDEENAM
ncbi:hypothetical protein A1O3_01909 [Capronia epimyces CBS 606.96]|uniref:DNA-directed RNA polymerase I subunit RPA34.5 n=1 Tax=Capronia epimyces CBS 606.96 TaxID=1182542 RepID=W9YGS9_9EURO|nr:uncharacterized protein A1O3_01909 [Capronia epimyces CBS 606.96]EXJ88845.1 hypothetical protein A1O3_01909 [Capronia epimyces CBS 606.96]